MPLTPEASTSLIQTDFSLAYESAGNVGTITHGIAGRSSLATFAYDYDAANRLAHETCWNNLLGMGDQRCSKMTKITKHCLNIYR